jgi:hypothetical protein
VAVCEPDQLTLAVVELRHRARQIGPLLGLLSEIAGCRNLPLAVFRDLRVIDTGTPEAIADQIRRYSK